jgi:carbamoyl-phosphate synthase large subunit
VIRSGISFENSIVRRDDLAQFTLAAAAEIGLKLAFGFQFKEDQNGIPKVLECNPRIQGTMVGSVFAGVNPIWLSVKASLGWPIRPEETKVRDAEFYRYWGGMGVVDGVAVDI